VAISPKAFEVLLCLIQRPGQVVTKEQLLQAVWPGAFVEEDNLVQHISALRKAFAGHASYIVTVPGRGYQFAAPVERVAAVERVTPGAVAPQPGDFIVQRVRERTHLVLEESILPPPAKRGLGGDFGAKVRARVRARTLVWAAAALGIVVLAGWFGWRRMYRTVPGDHHEVVLADFENSTGDPDFDKALNTALAVELKQSPYLLVASAAKRQETLKLMERSPREALTPALAREMCQRIGDQAVLDPTIARVGKKYMLTLTAVDCDSGEDLLESKSVADDPDSILQSLDSVAASMRRRLGEPLGVLRNTSKPLLAKKTNSLDALKVYTLAREQVVQGKFEPAIPLLQKAIELDPNFAVAYSDLGTVYSNLGEHDLAVKNFSKAYELRESAVQQDTLAIVAAYHSFVTGDLHESIRNYETWAALYPLAASPRANLASGQIQIGRDDLAVEPARQAVELAPNDTIMYVILARAEMHLGQFDEAKATCEKAVALKIDDAFVHGLLFEIASAQDRPEEMSAQVAWAKGKSAEASMLLDEALAAYSEGKAREAEREIDGMVDEYKTQGLTEHANRLLGGTPRIEMQLGRLEEARRRLAALPPLQGSTDIPVALALTGATAQAEAILQRELQLQPTDTLWQDVKGPEIRAAIAVAENKPEVAIQSLQRSLPYDLRNFDVPSLRGQAYLLAKQPDLAEAEFHKIIDHPGVEPLSSNLRTAHLGLARAYALQHREQDSRREYERFFELWKDADSDLPVLQQARAEYSRL
jgi:tetratricopeptide (TPR) repeat protein